MEFLDHRDGLVTYGVALRRDIAAAIRRHRPEAVITINHHETFSGGPITGWSAWPPSTPPGRGEPLAVPGGREPWSGVRQVLVLASPCSGHAVDVEEQFDRGVASLRAHEAYLESLGGPIGDAERFLRAGAEEAAARLPGSRLATAFEVIAS